MDIFVTTFHLEHCNTDGWLSLMTSTSQLCSLSNVMMLKHDSSFCQRLSCLVYSVISNSFRRYWTQALLLSFFPRQLLLWYHFVFPSPPTTLSSTTTSYRVLWTKIRPENWVCPVFLSRSSKDLLALRVFSCV